MNTTSGRTIKFDEVNRPCTGNRLLRPDTGKLYVVMSITSRMVVGNEEVDSVICNLMSIDDGANTSQPMDLLIVWLNAAKMIAVDNVVKARI